MPKSVTVILDNKLDRKLRLIQAKLIQKTGENISFSHTVNTVLESGLKNGKK